MKGSPFFLPFFVDRRTVCEGSHGKPSPPPLFTSRGFCRAYIPRKTPLFSSSLLSSALSNRPERFVTDLFFPLPRSRIKGFHPNVGYKHVFSGHLAKKPQRISGLDPDPNAAQMEGKARSPPFPSLPSD